MLIINILSNLQWEGEEPILILTLGGYMRGIPKDVWADEDRIMVHMGQMRMPLSKKECKRLFKREPRNELEARKFALRMKKGRMEVHFDNIQTKNDKKRETRKERLNRKSMRERGLLKIEMNCVLMKDGKDYPSMKECIEAAIANDSALVEREVTEKDELNLKFNVLGKRSKVDRDDQKSALGKITAMMEALSIDDSTKVTFSDQ